LEVQVTGFVEDLTEYYASARVALAPLLSGAGVKFKVLDALAQGVPVVATTIGAEGIASSLSKYLQQTDNPAEFAYAVARWLRPETRYDPAEIISTVSDAYNFHASMLTIVESYGQLLRDHSAEGAPGRKPHSN
jgi:glycosyltransferase involved in cell wall biosynthesis